MSDKTGNARTPPTRGDPRSEFLSRAYRDAVEGAAMEPDGSLDETIRAAAHEAVRARSGGLAAAGFREVLRRWRTPLALAATVLLAIGIALRLRKPTETEMMAPRAPTVIQSDQHGAGAKYEAPQPLRRIDENQQPKQAAGAALSRDAARPNEKTPAPNEKIPRQPGTNPSEAAPRQGFADQAEHNRNAKAGAGESPPSRPHERREMKSATNPFAGNIGAAPAPTQGTDSAAAARAQRARPSSAPGLSSFRAPTQGMEEGTGSATSPAAVQSILQRLEGRPAEVWVEEIRNLKRAGREADATELLVALRKKFPDFVLPEDLK